MPRFWPIFGGILILCVRVLPHPLQAQSQREIVSGGGAVIEVNAGKKANYRIPRTIYGTFLEPIGNSVYGGLWAQTLGNPSFEENLWSAENLQRMFDKNPELVQSSGMGLPLPWQPLDASQGWRYEPRWNDAANSYRSLMIMALPGKQTGVRQEVFLPVHRVLKYEGSFYAKPVDRSVDVEVSLRKRNHPEETLASTRLKIERKEWNRYAFQLNLSAGKLSRLEPADFVLALSDGARALFDQVFLFPADHQEGMDPEMIALAHELKTPVVRYGGNFTSGYHWRDGIGPLDKRVSMLNQSWGMPEYNHFGTDEFLRFCQLIGTEPQIALNLGSGTPEEAAEWVKYVNEHWHKNSGGSLWELGNELWGDFQIGHPTQKRVAALTKAFSDAVRGTDPRARLIATGQDPDHFREWNAEQLSLGPETFQYLSTHFVVETENVRRPQASPEFVALASFALPVGLERHLREMKTQIDANPKARNQVKIAFTEWLFYGTNDRTPRFNNMGGAVCTAGFLNTLLRVADFTPVSDMTGLIEFGGIWKKRSQVYAVPAYWAFRMYSNSDAAYVVDTRTSVESYDIHEGNHRIPEIPDVPYLDVVVAINEPGDKLTLFCVNRHLQRDITARIKVSDFVTSDKALVQQLAAESIYERNDEIRPEAVYPHQQTLEVKAPEFKYTFPPASVTLIHLRRR